MRNILLNSINKKYNLSWSLFLDNNTFNETTPLKPIYEKIPNKPLKEDFEAKFNFLDKIFTKKKENKINLALEKFNLATTEREKEKDRILKNNKKVKKDYENKLKIWEQKRLTFNNKKDIHNKKVHSLEHEFIKGKKEGVKFYIREILKKTQNEEYFTSKYDLDYDDNSSILIINFSLPKKAIIPDLKNMRYISSTDKYTSSKITQKQINKIYDDALYQITLKTLNDIFKLDYTNNIKSIVFNGWVNEMNKAIGKLSNDCIMSINVTRDEFLEINLSNVNPEACFKKLKGISSNVLSNLIPVAPIININKKDKRFVNSRKIDNIITGYNIAAMDWQEFEHLIRELFEKEWEKNGCDVKITQSSRDGGVDAIMFDPDPIKGGKFIIQAKRYTNVVGVSAVRDLYGALTSERAVKGILVTTSHFGSDAYNFAKDKPLVLIDGNQLLHLLIKNGYKDVRIDLKEAKQSLYVKMNLIIDYLNKI